MNHRKAKQKVKTLNRIISVMIVIGLAAVGVAAFSLFGENGSIVFGVSIAVLVMFIISIFIISATAKKIDRNFLEELPTFESRAIIRKMVAGTDKHNKPFFELTLESEKKGVQIYNVTAEQYSAVLENDVGVFTYREDDCGLTYFKGFTREGQRVNDAEVSVCEGCGARVAKSQFSVEFVCEYCGSKV
ncbi:MAG: hypothetical protein FWG45_01035 [Oscillospiraceae bacterium]|nr:hypothetical protein [Oscillospiraceae bacterium]